MSLNSAWWRFLENYVYAMPIPPPRSRTKPMEVIAIGPPRSATESLQAALLRLGYDHTHHGWDIVFEEPSYCRAWGRLARRKFFNDPPNKGPITTADFDEVLGNSVAVTDAAGSVFAAEMIRAYPDAKIVINKRKDLDKWLASMDESVLDVNRNNLLWFMSWFDSRLWWTWHTYERLLWPALFRCLDSREGFTAAARARGKSVYEEHCNMVRGMVPKERYLEWTAEDGWDPLCEFLGKPVPNEPFPYVNTKSKGWKEKEAKWNAELVKPALRNLGINAVVLTCGLAAAAAVAVRVWH